LAAAGCRRFDPALTGLGGCPFAGDELVGNIATETVLSTLAEKKTSIGIDLDALAPALELAEEIRRKYSQEHQE
jgi:hydroxymethylglutaryl-CoA lyase